MERPEDHRPPESADETVAGSSAGNSGAKDRQEGGTTPLPKPTGLGSPVSDAQQTPTTAATTPSTPSALKEHQAEGRPTFSPKELVANRYRIVRFIGQGGMGEVYEAEDLELREPVAVKTIRPEIAGDQRAIERFKREIQLARRVTHPNVSRIFDIEHHRTATGEEVTFLTMELLVGETLSERLHRAGRMSTAEGLPVVTQMAAGLEAAHRAGIVHRDFKSANVVLVPSTPDPGGVRAVVTDFGLARRLAGGEASAALATGSGDIIGTPAYMAPEQVKGAEVSAAADIYALGVVMYEMLTGTLPFKGDTPLAAAVRRLEEAPASPRTHVPDLDARWEAVILRCLERDPAERFARAEDVVKVLGGEEVAAGKRALEEGRRRALEARRKKRLRFALAGMAAVIVVAAAVAFHVLRDRQLREALKPQVGAVTATPVKPRRSIAVLGFKNLAGRADAAWLSTALSEMFTTELAAGEKLRAIPGEDVARMKVELSLADADSFAKDSLAKIRTNLGTDLVVLGSYIALGEKGGGQIRLDLRLQDTTAGETITSLAATGTEGRLFELVTEAGARLRNKLNIGEVSDAEAVGVRASLPSSSEATRLYSEGLAKLRQFDALAARERLEKAIAADPNFSLAHSALAAAWSALGYDLKAKQEAKKAVALSANLPREDRLWVEGRFRETTREWEKAIEIYGRLCNFFPDDLDYGLRLASVQTSAGRGKDALATVEALRRLPSPARDDPRIDLAEAGAAESLSDYKRQQAAAAKAVAKGQAQEARLLVARARLTEGSALLDLGHPDKARAAFEDAKRICAAAGDRRGVAQTLNSIARMLVQQGDLLGGRRMFEDFLAVSREIGDRSGIASGLNNIAVVLWQQGDLGGARRMYKEALAVYRETGKKSGVAAAANNIALVLNDQGDLAGAKRMYEVSLEASREIGDKSTMSMALYNIANLLFTRGDLAGAKKTLEESLAIRREIGEETSVAYALYALGEYLVSSGDLAAARKSLEESLAIRNRLGEKGTAAESRLALANLSVEEGRFAEAEALARQATEEFQDEKALDKEAATQAVLAEALSEQGKMAESQRVVNRASELARKSQNPAVRSTVTITAARIQVASGGPSEMAAAVKNLAAAQAAAAKVGDINGQFEARLALGEVEMKAGNLSRGRARLEALEKEAKARGFGLIARKAAAARK